MKKTILTVALTLCFVSLLGTRSRYDPAQWSSTSVGVSYSKSVGVSGAFNYAVDTASDDTYLAEVVGIAEYDAGLVIWLNPVTDNTTACTLNINSLGAKSLKTILGQDPGTGHIDAAQIVPLCYDGTNFIIMSPVANP